MITLPMFNSMQERDVRQVCQALETVLSRSGIDRA
jgi:dTDP-4-amino-4,6-dideoxygalactose transaminase